MDRGDGIAMNFPEGTALLTYCTFECGVSVPPHFDFFNICLCMVCVGLAALAHAALLPLRFVIYFYAWWALDLLHLRMRSCCPPAFFQRMFMYVLRWTYCTWAGRVSVPPHLYFLKICLCMVFVVSSPCY